MESSQDITEIASRASTGVEGFDDILDGGLTRNRIYLVEGDPGTGKTTMAFQFMLEGLRRGEKCLYITLSETTEELHSIAVSHGWDISQLDIFEMTPPEARLEPDEQYTLLYPAEVELGEATKLIFDKIEDLQPERVAFDSLAELRLIAQDPLRYRRQVLAMKRFFAGRQCTVLVLDDITEESDQQVHSITYGVILLQRIAREFGTDRRRIRVTKMRGSDFHGGFHDFTIRRGGITIFPRLSLLRPNGTFDNTMISSGVAELDALLGGGIERGTSLLFLGPAGAGKSSLATRYALAALERGESAAIYTFDEGPRTLIERARGLGMKLDPHLDSGGLLIEQVNAAELSPGEFAHRVRERVDRMDSRIVVIDSMNSYLHAMPGEQFLVMQMHELLSYLNQRGVLSILVMAQQGMLGQMPTPVDLSYLTDSVILLRYFEFEGAVRKAISVVKKRGGPHEGTIREYHLGAKGIIIGPTLTDFHGVLTGVPVFHGRAGELHKDEHGSDK
jgi:circadian clock protein KaiC